MLKKGSMSVYDYILKMRNIADTLASTGQLISGDELLLYILGGLGSEYDPIVINLTSKQDSVSLQEAQFLLQSHEMRLEQLQVSMIVNLASASANVAYNNNNSNFSSGRGSQGGRGQGGRGNTNFHGGRSSHGRGRSGYKPMCYIYKKTGHTIAVCYFRFDNDYQHPPPRDQHSQTNSGNSNAYIATSDTVDDPAWYVDSGAISHVTLELDNLSVKSYYKGKSKLHGGDGNALDISHIGSSLIPSQPLKLKNILHVPKITRHPSIFSAYSSSFSYCVNNNVSVSSPTPVSPSLYTCSSFQHLVVSPNPIFPTSSLGQHSQTSISTSVQNHTSPLSNESRSSSPSQIILTYSHNPVNVTVPPIINQIHRPCPSSTHVMTTRSKTRVFKPKCFHVSSPTVSNSISREATSVNEALLDPNWK